MSVVIDQLTKTFGEQTAVEDISFEAKPGEILGFLGPNGAGKSTTMRIATGFLPPDAGAVSIEGYDIIRQPMEARRQIGYLPEHNPLYPDMYIREYLQFIGQLQGMDKASIKSRIPEMMQLCGLENEKGKKIGALSKGYRQRVGIAQALLHDPKVLILDEPTTGLDPNQIIEIRNLIKHLSLHKTVILSTHIMQEVQAICDRVVIIHLGRIVKDSRLEELDGAQKQTPSLQVEFSEEVNLQPLQNMDEIADIEHISGYRYRIIPQSDHDIRPKIFQYAASENLPLISLEQEKAPTSQNSLEALFHQLTQNPKEEAKQES